MPTTIARRIRRIGLLPLVKNEQGVITARPREEFSHEAKLEFIKLVRERHYAHRDAAKKNPATKPHRRCKARKSAEKKAA